MTWEELIDKLKDTNVDLINYADISKKETQKEFENNGITPDIVYLYIFIQLYSSN